MRSLCIDQKRRDLDESDLLTICSLLASRLSFTGRRTHPITKEFGVHVTAPSRQQWPGLVRIILNMRWETEPGWIALTFASPVLCVVLSETGGRCQTRIQHEQPAQG